MCAQGKLHARDAELEELRGRLSRGATEGRSLGANVVELSGKLALVEGELKVKKEANAKLEIQVAALAPQVPELSARLEDMVSKRDELREVVRLLAQLGGKRMEWGLPEKSVDELRAVAADLAVKVEEAKARKEKSELLGKVEAELWRRKEEAPAAVGSLSTEELQATLRRLQMPGADDAARDDA